MMLNLGRKPVKKFPVNPRVRAYGKARLDIASRAQSTSDWDKLWKNPAYPFPFTWGEYWKQCIEYKVDDFAAEVGFYTDILGLPVNALDPGYAMFTSPGGDFFIAIVPTLDSTRSTPPDAIRIQFMVADVFGTAGELERRGIKLEQWPQPCADGSTLYIGYFRTPHGICVDLWGLVVGGDKTNTAPSVVLAPEDESDKPLGHSESDDEHSLDVDLEVDLQTGDQDADQPGDMDLESLTEPEEITEYEYVNEDDI